MFTHGSSAGSPSMRQTKPGNRWTYVSAWPVSFSSRSAVCPPPSAAQPVLVPEPSAPYSTTTVTPALPGQAAAEAAAGVTRQPSPPAAAVTRTAAAERSRTWDTVSS